MGTELDAPAVGIDFEPYDDATEVGFRVRVKNSWFEWRSKEKYGVVLCCSSQGFKRINDVNRARKETRTGCPAMIRIRQVDSQRWRVLEVTLDHNYLLGSNSVISMAQSLHIWRDNGVLPLVAQSMAQSHEVFSSNHCHRPMQAFRCCDFPSVPKIPSQIQSDTYNEENPGEIRWVE